MPVKLFILGLPGSGKSAVARYISAKVYAEGQHWATTRFNDYKILDDMFHQDTAGRFKPAESGGFDVLDLKVFDEALQTLEQEVNMYIDTLKPEEKKLVLIEFSRNDYHDAFQLLNRSFLTHAYFLYFYAEVEVCKKRIQHRVADPRFEEDDHPVSDYIFENYYYGDDEEHLAEILASDYKVDGQRVLIVNNNGSLQEVLGGIITFMDAMFEDEVPARNVSLFISKGEEAK
jgi:thymidylate kinase